MYFYGNPAAKDFMELFLMAANGYGYEAMKLLRSMYERRYKLMNRSSNTFGETALPAALVAALNADTKKSRINSW